MPYRSAAQRRKFHAMLARGEILPEVVAEFDRASKGMRLPEYVPEPTSHGPRRPRKGKKKMATRRKSPKRRAGHHTTRRRRDPAAATSRHRRRAAPKRKPAKRRASGFSLRDFLGIGDPGPRRRTATKRKAAKKRCTAGCRCIKCAHKRASARRDWPKHPRLHAKAARKGRRKGHKTAKKRAASHRRRGR
jgi:hypothetical protein